MKVLLCAKENIKKNCIYKSCENDYKFIVNKIQINFIIYFTYNENSFY